MSPVIRCHCGKIHILPATILRFKTICPNCGSDLVKQFLGN